MLCRAFAYVGERSLFVFLAHSFVFQALIMLGIVEWVNETVPTAPLAVALSFGFTLLTTLAGDGLLRRAPRMYMAIFPRHNHEWQKALGLVKA
jgi:fucose 4-O-acetylase-like acetyltransferase